MERKIFTLILAMSISISTACTTFADSGEFPYGIPLEEILAEETQLDGVTGKAFIYTYQGGVIEDVEMDISEFIKRYSEEQNVRMIEHRSNVYANLADALERAQFEYVGTESRTFRDGQETAYISTYKNDFGAVSISRATNGARTLIISGDEGYLISASSFIEKDVVDEPISSAIDLGNCYVDQEDFNALLAGEEGFCARYDMFSTGGNIYILDTENFSFDDKGFPLTTYVLGKTFEEVFVRTMGHAIYYLYKNHPDIYENVILVSSFVPASPEEFESWVSAWYYCGGDEVYMTHAACTSVRAAAYTIAHEAQHLADYEKTGDCTELSAYTASVKVMHSLGYSEEYITDFLTYVYSLYTHSDWYGY